VARARCSRASRRDRRRRARPATGAANCWRSDGRRASREIKTIWPRRPRRSLHISQWTKCLV
jgi:hypothetical protein